MTKQQWMAQAPGGDRASGGEARKCPRCQGKLLITRGEVDYAVGEVCSRCAESCPRCSGEGHIFVEHPGGYMTTQECPACGGLRRRVQLFNQARLPARYHNKGLEDFKSYLNPTLRQGIGNLPEVRGVIYTLVNGFIPGDKGLLLIGPVGTGKTHLVVALVRHLTLEKGIACRFIEFTHLLGELRQAFERKDNAADLLDRLSTVPVLVIDELGKGRKTDWELSVIDELISKRYNRCLSTFFTSNYELDAPRLPASGSGRGPVDTATPDFQRAMDTESLVDRLGASIVSRIHEMATVIRMQNVPDHRKLIAAYG